MKHPTSKEIEFDCKTLKDKFCKDTEYQECKSELWDNPFLDLILKRQEDDNAATFMVNKNYYVVRNDA